MISFIIQRSRLLEKIFIALFLISAVCFPLVKVNYDLSKYLPSDMPSKQGIDLMEDEFGYPGTARIMIGNVSLYEAKIYKDNIEKVDGVDMVTWADSLTDVYQSDVFIPYKDIEDYYKDGYSVMDVTFKGNDSAESTRQALREIEKMLGDKGYFSGPAVQNKFLNEVITRQMGYIMIFSVLVILGILTLATNSWFEPVLFLVVILISIVINMGSNIFLGSISSMTLSVAAVLQLAIAMDYTIILLDNFTRERKHQVPVEEALSHAIRKSIIPIASAGAAAIVGFSALTLMHYSIGRDMGLVLAKGIATGMVTVMFLTPAFILRWYKIIEKTEHRPFIPSFDRITQKMYKFRFVFLILLVLLAIPSYFGKDMTNFTFGNDAMGLSVGTKVYNDTRFIDSKFGRSNLVLVLVPNSSMVTEARLSDALEELPYVKGVTSLAKLLPEGIPEDFVPDGIKGKLHTDKYARLLIPIKTANESELAFSSVDGIQSVVKKYYPRDSYVIGNTPSTMDIRKVIVGDWKSIDKLSLLGVALAIMIAFRSLALPLILLIPIQIAVFINMMVPYLAGNKIMFMGYVIVSCLQLGATIDYSIILTYRYLEHRKASDKVTAAKKAASESMLPILTSGLILAVAGFGVSKLSSVTAISNLGELIGRGALLSMLTVITLLPSLFVWADKIIMVGIRRLPLSLGRKGKPEAGSISDIQP